MDKPNLNVMIFDDDQEPSREVQIKKYTSTSKSMKPSNTNGHSSQKNLKKPEQPSRALSKQIQQMQQKLRSLQKQGERIRYELQKRPNGINQSGIITNGNSKSKETEQVLLVVEKKIQLLVKQSSRLLNKMSETIEKKLMLLQKQEINQKRQVEIVTGKTKDRVEEMENVLRSKIQQYELFYKGEYEKLVKENRRKEEAMMKKLSEIQLKFTNKVNTFETKEKQYVDWIHHLQAKLKQRKSKKMITITQEKPQLSPIQSKSSIQSNQNVYTQNQNNAENVSSANFQQSKMNCSIDQNNSKIIRKHKIFGGKSTSPQPRSNISPTKDSNITPASQQPKQVPFHNPQQSRHPKPQSSSFYQQSSQHGQQSHLNFYNDLRSQKPQLSSKHPQQYNSSHVGGWDKFADLNDFTQGDEEESESDDFFTPIDINDMGYSNNGDNRVLANIPLESRGGTYYRANGENNLGLNRNQYGYGNSPEQFYEDSTKEKVFSPFDLN